jgi:TRAP-type C4-dicarboxylate transport system permease small subunit
VFLRYVLREDFRGSDEYVRIILIWVVFLGAAVAMNRVAHLGINLIASKLPRSVVRYLDVVAYLVVCGVALMMIYQGAIVAKQGFTNTFTMSGVPVGYQYTALPVSGALILVYALHNLFARKTPIPEHTADIEKLDAHE